MIDNSEFSLAIRCINLIASDVLCLILTFPAFSWCNIAVGRVSISWLLLSLRLCDSSRGGHISWLCIAHGSYGFYIRIKIDKSHMRLSTQSEQCDKLQVNYVRLVS